jgi:hypothetical protein
MQIRRDHTRGHLVPVAIAVLVAVLSTVALFFLEFGAKHEVARDGVSMITSAAADRAGAIVLPTVDYKAEDQNRTSYFRILR